MPKVLTQIAFFFLRHSQKNSWINFLCLHLLISVCFLHGVSIGVGTLSYVYCPKNSHCACGLNRFDRNHSSKRLNWYFSLITFFTLAAAASATRHLYIQSLPLDQIPSCGPDLEYLIKFSYFGDALRMLFIGDGNCAEVVWSLLGISIPGWVLIACVQILLMSALFFKVKV